MTDVPQSSFSRGQMVGAVFIAFGASFGALGAHALEAVMTPERLDSWGTATLYLLVMGAALVGASNISQTRASRLALVAVMFGTVLFSGSIMGLVTLLTLDAGAMLRAVLGPLTPLGGVLMIAGWMLWAVSLRRR